MLTWNLRGISQREVPECNLRTETDLHVHWTKTLTSANMLRGQHKQFCKPVDHCAVCHTCSKSRASLLLLQASAGHDTYRNTVGPMCDSHEAVNRQHAVLVGTVQEAMRPDV